MVLKIHLEPVREPLKVPPVGQPKNLFFPSKTKSVPCKTRMLLEGQFQHFLRPELKQNVLKILL